jgi:hypothetical protein
MLRLPAASLCRRVRLAAAPIWMVLAGTTLTGCDLDQFVQATDPDVIAPEFVNTPSGANAVRIGTLGRFNAATTAGETMFLYGGLLGDEFTTGDTFTQRVETDQRSLTVENANVSDAYRQIHRVRIGAIQAREATLASAPSAPAWHRAEMFFVEAYMINMLAEYFCNGQPLSTIKDGVESYGAPVPTTQLYATALAKADSGAALVASTGNGADDVRVRNALALMRSRIFLNQANWQQAAAAVTGVPTSYVWFQEHSLTTRTPGVWSFVNNQRRYIVSNNEGPAQLNFGTANDPRVPTCTAGTPACAAASATTARPFDSGNSAVPNMLYQLVWTTDASSVALMSGLQARLYEAEAQNQLGNFPAALTILNALRAAPPGYGRAIAALPALTDPGTAAGRRDLIFREKAFWLFGLGHRYPDMRRLVRQYGLPQNQVFPSGTWQINRVPGYGSDVVFPTPQAESNNPEYPLNALSQPACIDRNA